MEFSGKVGDGPMNKWLNFGAIWITDPDPDTYRDTGGDGMHCPSASNCRQHFVQRKAPVIKLLR